MLLKESLYQAVSGAGLWAILCDPGALSRWKNGAPHPQHPARLLLNALVAAGERWVEPEGKSKSDVFAQMKAVVKRILDDFDDDLGLFSQLAFEFNHYLRQHVRRVRLALMDCINRRLALAQ